MNILAQAVEQDFTVDDSLPQGFLFGSIKNVGNQVAQVNGVNLLPGEAKAYPFVGKGYQSISFQVNGSTLRIMLIT